MTLWQTLQGWWDPLRDLLPSDSPINTTLPALEAHALRLKHPLGSPAVGNTRRLFKGHGLDLKHLREYVLGDDLRKIDWNVTARLGHPHVREHYEERAVPVWFWLDTTVPMHFGQTQSKLAVAAQLITVLAQIALEEGHPVGLMRWTGSPEMACLPPAPHAQQARAIQHLLTQTLDSLPPQAPITGFPELAKIIRNRSLVLLFSDFGFVLQHPDFVEKCHRLSAKHQVEAMLLVDPVERDLVYGHGILPLGAREHQPVWINTDDRWVIKAYRKAFQKTLRERQEILGRVSRVHRIDTDTPMAQVLRHVVSAA